MNEIALMCARCDHVKLIPVRSDVTPLIHQRCPECDGPMGPMEDLLARRAEKRGNTP